MLFDEEQRLMLDRCYIHLFPGAAPGGKVNVPDPKITNLMTGSVTRL
jgi:hypothetical protein